MNPLNILNQVEQANDYFERLFNKLVDSKLEEESGEGGLNLTPIEHFLEGSRKEADQKLRFIDNNKKRFRNLNNYILVKALLYEQKSRDEAIRYIRKAKQLESEDPFWDFLDIVIRSDFEVEGFNLKVVGNIPIIKQNDYAWAIISFIQNCQQLERHTDFESTLEALQRLQQETETGYLPIAETLTVITHERFVREGLTDILSERAARNSRVRVMVDQGVRLNGNTEPLWFILKAWINLWEKDYEGAIDIFQRIQNETEEINILDPSLHWSYVGLYKGYLYSGDEQAAMGTLEQFIDFISDFKEMMQITPEPQFPFIVPDRIHWILYRYYRSRGNYEAALDRMEDIKKIHESSVDSEVPYADILQIIGELHYLQEEYDQALGYFYQSIKYNPTDEQIKQRIRELSSITLKESDELVPYPGREKQKLFTELVKSNFEVFNQAISAIYPFTGEQLQSLRARLNWRKVSHNRAINWNKELIRKYEDLLNFTALSRNPSLPWNKDLIRTFSDRWNWEDLSTNEGIPWNREMITAFQDQLYFMGDFDGLSSSRSVLWSEEMLDAFSTLLDWRILSENQYLPWDIELIDKYKHNWYWEKLSANSALPWSKQLIHRYRARWDWEVLSNNPGIPLNYGTLKEFEDDWHWRALVHNDNFPWEKHIKEAFSHKMLESELKSHQGQSIYHGIKNLSKTNDIMDNPSYFDDYLSVEFIIRYFQYIDLFYREVTINEELYLALREHYGVKELNEQAHWIVFEEKVLNKYSQELDWNNISKNENYNWSLDFMVNHAPELNFEKLPERVIEKVAFPYLDDQTLMECYG